MTSNHFEKDRSPRICAHQGLSAACPANTLPAFGAAMAVGADEIEFDVRLSRDGVPVVCHDATVDRMSTGKGRVSELEWSAIRRLEAGAKHSPAWRGVTIPRLEEVFDLVGARVGLNIHVKETGAEGILVKLVCDMIRKQGLLELAYLAGDEAVLRTALEYAPEVSRACLHAANEPPEQIRVAQKYACQRIQFARHHVSTGHIRRAHEADLTCNLFWSDDAKDALEYARNGIDVVLTNCAHQLIADGVRVPA